MLFIDACLCPGMQKVVAGTNRGRLMLFDAKKKGQVINSTLPVNEIEESNMIVKVAHDVRKLSDFIHYPDVFSCFVISFMRIHDSGRCDLCDK